MLLLVSKPASVQKELVLCSVVHFVLQRACGVGLPISPIALIELLQRLYCLVGARDELLPLLADSDACARLSCTVANMSSSGSVVNTSSAHHRSIRNVDVALTVRWAFLGY